jgi:gamma-glutamyltranspeptidase/glutathione hydrolase
MHRIVEAGKLAFADREAWYGDALPPPLTALLDPAYTAARRTLIGERASLELRPGAPGGQQPRLATHLGAHVAGDQPGLGEPTVAYHGDTCHVDVVDRWGTMVSATPSGGWLQSSPVIPELGFPLGSRLQMCWLEEGLPGTLTPGRRPRTTLSPTLIYRDGLPVIAMGTPGGDQQDQWQLSLLLSHLARRLPLQQAIETPKWHSTAFPSSFHPRDTYPGQLVVEDRFAPEVVDGLRARGHEVVLTDGWSLGRLSAVSREPATGLLQAAADPRDQGYAAGR